MDAPFARTLYALIVTGDVVYTRDGHAMTAKGTEYWVCREREGWVEATAFPYRSSCGIPHSLLTFDTREAASAFGERWTGHPWWVKPVGFRVVEVSALFKLVPDGYRVVES